MVMKKQITFLLCFMLFSTFTNAQNFVTNPGFEDVVSTFTVVESSMNVLMRTNNSFFDAITQTSNPTVSPAVNITPGMWVRKSTSTGYVKGIVITSDKKSGTSSLNLRIAAGLTTADYEKVASARTVSFQKLATSLTNSKKYVASVWAKADGTANNQCTALTFYLTDATDKTLFYTTVSLTGGTTWTQYQVTFDLPALITAKPNRNFSTAYFGVGIVTTYDAQATPTTYYSGIILDDFSLAEEVVTQLSTPTLKKANAVSKSGFKAIWNAVANASSYDVKVFEGATQVGSTQNTTSTSLAITGLTANTAYTYTVTAKGTGNYTDSDESAASAVVTTLTTDKDYVLSQYADTEVADLKADLIAGDAEIYELTTSGGAYQFTSTTANSIILTKSATIRALSGLANKPVISINNSAAGTPTIFAINAADVTLRLEGLECNGVNAGTGLQNILVYGLATTSSNTAVIVRDCYIHDFKNAATQGAFHFRSSASFDMQESIINDCTGRFINLYTDGVTYGDIILKNNTFNNVGADISGTAGAIVMYRSAGSNNIALGTNFTVEHCTFNNFTGTLTDVLTFRSMSGLISVKNSIFTNITRGLNFTNPNGFVIDECYLGGFANEVTNVTNRTVTNTIATAPAYTDANANNFVLTNKSALICTNGYVAGNTYGAVLTPLTVPAITIGSSSSDVGFTANWESKANASGYIVNVYKDGSKVKSTRVGAVTSTTFNDLTPNTSYTYKVIAIGDATTYSSSDESDESDPISTSNIFNVTGTTAISTLTSKNASSAINVASGATLTINEAAEVASVTVAPGGRLNLNAQLTATLSLQSDENGTATLIDNTELASISANVQQYLATTRNWYISSPVSGAVAPAGYTYYQRDEAGASWTSQPFVVGNTFTPGKGYIALPDAAGSTISFSGTINNGEISIPLTWAGATSKGFNLIGNPYPSHLTWTQAFAEATTAPDGGVAPATLIEPSIYVRTNAGTTNGSGQWSFQTYNASTGLAVPSQALLSGGIIPPMQAFWVKAKQAGNLILTSDLTKSHQTGNPLKAPAVQTTERQLIRLEVSNGTRTDETLLFFDANAENGYDRYDSPKFAEADTELQLFTTIANEKLVMNGLKTMPLNQEIALGFVPGSATSFSIKANQLTNLPSDVQVILKDNANDGVETNLTDGESVYNFTTTESSGNRFSLILRAPDVSTNVENTGKLYTRVITNASGQIEIHAPANSSYAVFNAMGQKVSFGSTSSEVHALHLNLSSGMYVVKVNDITGKVIIK
jgi:hypothetical protein